MEQGRTEEVQQRSAGQCQTAGGALEEETQERGEGFDGGQVGKWQIQMWCKAQLQTGESPEGAAGTGGTRDLTHTTDTIGEFPKHIFTAQQAKRGGGWEEGQVADQKAMGGKECVHDQRVLG